MSDRNQNNLKIFFIKLLAITFSIIIIINATYNLILADKLENFNKIIQLNKKENIESVKNKISSKTRLIFLANPGNPTGTYIRLSEIDRFLSTLPQRIAVIIDG